MPEHLLNAAEVGAALEQVRRERVPQQVRVDAFRLEARAPGETPQDQERACARERPALSVEEELLRRGLEDDSPACRGSALLSLELLSREHPRTVNSVRPLLHNLANADGNEAVRRLAILALRNGSPQRDTIVLLQGIGEEEGSSRDVRETAAKVAAGLDKRAKTR